jgi:hypothetical protein
MTKEELKALGLNDEQADKIVEDYGKNFVAKSQFNAKNDELKALKAERQTAQAELDKLKADNANNADLVKQLDELKAAQAKREEEYAAQVEQMKLDAAVDRSLVAAKVKNAKAVRALLDMGAVKLDGEKISGLDEQIKALKTSDGYLFEQDAQISGIIPGGGADPAPKNSIEQLIDGAIANV